MSIKIIPSRQKKIEDEENGGGGRMLTILLVATAVVAGLYLFFGRGSGTKEEPPTTSNVVVIPASAQIAATSTPSRWKVLEVIENPDLFPAIPGNHGSLVYLEDHKTRLCYLSTVCFHCPEAFMTEVPCINANPVLRSKNE